MATRHAFCEAQNARRVATPLSFAFGDIDMASIRAPQVNDAPALIAMVRQFPTPTPSTDESLLEIFSCKLRDPCSYLLVAEDETGLVGYISGCCHVAFYAGGNTAWIDEIFVKEERRGNGIGRLLMAALETRAAADGCSLVALATAGAGPFYSRIGYEGKASYFKKYLRVNRSSRFR